MNVASQGKKSHRGQEKALDLEAASFMDRRGSFSGLIHGARTFTARFSNPIDFTDPYDNPYSWWIGFLSRCALRATSAGVYVVEIVTITGESI